MPYDKIDQRSEGDLQITMTHEVLTSDRLEDPVVRGFIMRVVFALLLGQELGSFLLEHLFVHIFVHLFVREFLGIISLGDIVGGPRLLALPSYQCSVADTSQAQNLLSLVAGSNHLPYSSASSVP